MAVCAYCMARHWECKGRTGHRSTCCSQGKVQHAAASPSPAQSRGSFLKARMPVSCSVRQQAKAFRENARSYNNALSFTSLAAHWDQSQVGTLGPPVFRVFGRLYHRLGALIPAVNQRPAFAQTWLIDRAKATDTRLGPDGADSRIQRSTLTKLESILRTGNRFVREPGPTHPQPSYVEHGNGDAAMLICDSDTNTGDRGRQDLILQVHGDRCPEGRPKYQIVSSLHPSAMPLRYPLLFPAGEDGFHPNIPLCGFYQAGPPIARNREQIDNGVQLRELLAGLGLDDEDEEEDEDRDDDNEDGEEGDEENGDDEPYNRPDLIARVLEAKSGNKQRPGCFGDGWILFLCCGCPEGRLWWMYYHTVVSAAPACGVYVPIRSHVQALWQVLFLSRQSNEATAFPVFYVTF
ncbi:BQ5605_C001g00288 [Microbotryum silenes-dioicae]|uniref:BQ5605_C001g00288 protein n=1 Tax=Microbotryum silenes-dioicae TaxID=796604 RepID=A0A2X0M6U1_9BASI|nr:BQ5605_C001g00288 [Microbotryum silenes-dioicae]